MSKATPSPSRHPRFIQLSSLEYNFRARQREQTNTLSANIFGRVQPHSQNVVWVTHLWHQSQRAARRALLIAGTVLITLFYPIGAYAVEPTTPAEPTTVVAESSPAAEAPSTPPASSPALKQDAPPAPTKPKTGPTQPTGPTKPPGPDGSTYIYNEDTKVWENDHYTWDAASGKTKPKQTPDYSYNPETNMWDTTEHRYDPASGTYKPHKVQSAQAPQGAADSNVTSGTFDLFYNNQISNGMYAQALSGNATVSGNTTGGNATSGNALTMANIINLLNASSGFNAGTIATFSSDIYGDVVGDLFIDPAALAALQPAGSQQLTNGNTTLGVEISQNNQIQNDVDLVAQSGDATVSGNTTGGNATTGNAHAVANVVNMLNSVIGSGQSFVGALNIYGNLNGDILFPPEVLDTLLASNAPKANISAQNIQNTEVLAEFANNQTIHNNVNASAQSGDASVSGNTTGGDATTGSALTNINIINLTGKQVIAANSLLVFVNVMGEWVGVIMDAPSGSTSGMLGTGVSQNTTNVSADYTASASNDITNNINVHAQSGDASVTNNTTGGDATSGNATASVNIANLINSTFSLSDWFGLLFINVYGRWNGSVGVDTAAGTVPRPVVPKAGLPKGTTVRKEDIKVFRFVPTNSGANRLEPVYDVGSADYTSTHTSVMTDTQSSQQSVLGADIEQFPAETSDANQADYWLPLFGFMVGSSLLGVERATSNRNRRKVAK